MSENPVQTPPSPPEPSGGPSVGRIALIATLVYIGVILLFFIGGFTLAVVDIDRAAEVVRLLRDLFIIVLSMVSILIVIALAVLIVQIAGLVNLLQTEIKPLLENVQDTLKTAKGTAQFVGQNVAEPLIKVGGFMAGLAVFTRELGGIRRAIRPQPPSANGSSQGEQDAG